MGKKNLHAKGASEAASGRRSLLAFHVILIPPYYCYYYYPFCHSMSSLSLLFSRAGLLVAFFSLDTHFLDFA